MSITSAGAGAPAQLAETEINARLRRDPASGGFRLPYGLRPDFDLVSQLPKQGAEAVLVLVRPRESEGPLQVLKLYGRDLGLRADILTLLEHAPPEHVVRLMGFGTEQGVGYELLEYVPGGDLEDHVRRVGGLDEPAAREAIAELAHAIECIHRLTTVEVAHGDLKPGNVLVRSTDPLDLVLADFGMATLQHDTRSSVLGTPRWSDPRAHTGYVQPEGDWWSLGALAHWLRTGRPLMDGMVDAAAIDYLREHNADLSALPQGEPYDWSLLCRGLLTRDESQRWGAAQVREWLAGGSPAVGSQWDPPPSVVVEPEPTHPITFGGQTYLELGALAIALAEQWDQSCALIDRNPEDLASVLAEHARQIKDLDLARDVREILGSPEQVDLRLSRLLRRLAPGMTPLYRTWAIGPDGLAGLADRAAANPDSPEAGALAGIHDGHVLRAWDYPIPGGSGDLDGRWHDSVTRWADAMTSHMSTPTEVLTRRARAEILLALIRPTAAQELATRARKAASRRARGIDWYDTLLHEAGRDPAVAYGAICLAPTAEAHADEVDEARRAERNRRATQRDEDNLRKVPMTRRILGWCLLAQAWLLGLWAWLRVLAPNRWAGARPEDALAIWADDLPARVANWVTWWTDPWVIIPLFSTSAVLYVRARSDGPEGTAARHPWERRAMQAAIALTCLLIPPLIPLCLVGWWRGLQFYAPDPIRGRDALRTISMGSGMASVALLVGLVVGVGPSPEALGLTAEYQQWAAKDDILTALGGPITAVGNLAGGMPATGGALVVTVLVCVAGPLLVALGAHAYEHDSRPARRALGGLVLVGLVGLANLPLAYLPKTWGLAGAAAVAAWVGWTAMRGRR